MSDRLTLAHAFEDAGLPRDKAEQVATAVLNAIRDNVATKTEIDLARADLLHMEDRLNAHIGQVGIKIESRIDLVEHRLLTRLGGLIVVLAGLLFAALHYWPPGHG